MQRISNIIEPVYRFIWHSDLHTAPRWRGHLVRWARIIWLLAEELNQGQLSMRAMSLVYTTLLSLVPLLAVSFSVLKAFGVQNQIEPMLLNFLAPLGPKGGEITATIIGFVDNMRVGILGAVGLGMLLYTVVSLIQKVERTFNYTWHVPQSRPFAERFSDYLSVLLIGPVLVFTALGATASIMSTTLVQSMEQVPLLGWLIQSTGKLIPYFLVICAFTFVYVFVPNTKVRLGPAAIGALVAGVLWQTVGWGFASFVVNSTKYAAIYSGFAILILFMIWLYLAWLILLTGASIAFYHQHPEYLKLQPGPSRCTGNRLREHLGLHTLCLIAESHFAGSTPPSAEQLANRLGTTPDLVQETLNLLQRNGLVLATHDEPETYLPARAAERIPLQAAYDALRSGDVLPPSMQPGDAIERSNGILAAIESAAAGTLQGLTLRDLLIEAVSPAANRDAESDPRPPAQSEK